MTRSKLPADAHEIDRDYHDRLSQIQADGQGGSGYSDRGQPRDRYSDQYAENGQFAGHDQYGRPYPDPHGDGALHNGYYYPRGQQSAGHAPNTGYASDDVQGYREPDLGGGQSGYSPAPQGRQWPDFSNGAEASFGQEPNFAPASGFPSERHEPAFNHPSHATPDGYQADLQPGNPSPGYFDDRQGYDPGYRRRPIPEAREQHAAAPDLRGATYDDWPPRQPQPDHSAHHGDVSGFDLSSYGAPGGQPSQGYAADGRQEWDSREAARGVQAGYDQPVFRDPADLDGANAVAVHETEYDDEYDDEDYEEEDASGTRRVVALAAAMVLAVALGGGLAYGYKTFFLDGKSAGPGVIVRAGGQPDKVAPKDPGGQRFANTDSKLLGRLDDGRPTAAASAGREPGERVRPVSTIIVRPDGSLVEDTSKPPVRSVAAPAPSGVSSPIPGMTIVGARPEAPLAAGTPPVTVAPVTRTSPPVVIANAAPTTAPSAETRESVSAPATEPSGVGAVSSIGIPLPVRNTLPRTVSAAAPERVEPREVAVRAPEPSSPPETTSSATGAGYVAVIASQGSRIEALKSFADLREKYGPALAGAIPDVQAADLSSRGLGTMYRVVVGPPGSRAAANETCSKLKTAGYDGCWVKAY